MTVLTAVLQADMMGSLPVITPPWSLSRALRGQATRKVREFKDWDAEGPSHHVKPE